MNLHQANGTAEPWSSRPRSFVTAHSHAAISTESQPTLVRPLLMPWPEALDPAYGGGGGGGDSEAVPRNLPSASSTTAPVRSSDSFRRRALARQANQTPGQERFQRRPGLSTDDQADGRTGTSDTGGSGAQHSGSIELDGGRNGVARLGSGADPGEDSKRAYPQAPAAVTPTPLPRRRVNLRGQEDAAGTG